MGSVRIPRQSAPLLRHGPLALHQERLRRGAPDRFGAAGKAVTSAWSRAPLLSDVLDPKHNAFSVLRLIMALAVLVSHAVFLATGSFLAEPLVTTTGYSLGQYGVQGFFILSGILVTQSLVTRGDLWDYGRARALRIFPALIVCVAVSVLIVGPALSMLDARAYFASSGVALYVAKTLSLSTGSAHLPGLFMTNPAVGVVNQSLWTLKYEVACYLLLGGFAALVWRATQRRLAVTIAVAAWIALMVAARPGLTQGGNFFETLSYFTLFFGTGAVAFMLRHKIRLCWPPVVGFGLLFAACIGSDWAEISSALFLGYGLLWVATLSFGSLRAYANHNDYSYGTYIYSYPVTQAVLVMWPNVNLLALIATVSGVTLMLAFLSWEFVERPALSLVRGWRKKQLERRIAVSVVDAGSDAAETIPNDGSLQPWVAAQRSVYVPKAASMMADRQAMSPANSLRLRGRIAGIAKATAGTRHLS